ncbi:MAG: hypothetical protein JSS76_00545 [Bacteroidetes bacterium]|nr:hypothetical protein [Bacteroidota bacterium]
MKNSKGVISITANHIEPGIKKYKGEIDAALHNIMKSAGLSFTPYLFNDGRVLLVLPNNTAAFLYASKEVLYETLSLT